MDASREQTTGRTITFLLFTLFALSGAAGLIYEVVWVRQFTRILGASTYAVTIILATFMAGLGLGSWLLGKTGYGGSVTDSEKSEVMEETWNTG